MVKIIHTKEKNKIIRLLGKDKEEAMILKALEKERDATKVAKSRSIGLNVVYRIAKENKVKLKTGTLDSNEKKEILVLLDQGFSKKKIAQKLSRSEITVYKVAKAHGKQQKAEHPKKPKNS